MSTVVPKDTYVMSYGVFYLLGIMLVVPHFFYLNAFDFWMYRFDENRINNRKNMNSSLITLGNKFSMTPFNKDIVLRPAKIILFRSFEEDIKVNSDTGSTDRNRFQVNVTSALSLNFQTLMLLCLIFFLMYCKKLPPPERRLTCCLCSISIIFSFSIIITQIRATSRPPVLFSITMVVTTILNCLSGTAMATLYELITEFPTKCLIYLQCGQCICGILAGILRIALIPTCMRQDQITAIYFSFGSFIMISVTIYYCYVVKTSKFFIYSQMGEQQDERLLKRVKLKKVLNKGKWFYAAIFFAYGTTHAVNPGLLILVLPTIADSYWKKIYFVPVITLLGFHGFLLLGRELSRLIKTPKNGLILFIFSVLRIIFVPLFIFCNARPRKGLPVYFEDNDYIIIMAVFGITEGILVIKSLLAMLPLFEGDERKAAMIFVPLVSASALTAGSMINVLITNMI
ncbi:equilibrative nucleoside transporter 1-like isoform X2 [Diorhabda carinulata]|uniref:equilibrative nucleoside transporter 1-like isoform X2 n=1 Tax=Diorhabda carinulata TaxID=1163345 RepID=UPI0025A0BE2E|nr:equilibrative nucleoside transporter 1-like isoform X2 [Diorhabda carinulata]